MTSNLEIQNKVGFSKQENQNLEESLSKEFLGRFSAIIPYELISRRIKFSFFPYNCAIVFTV